MIKLHTKACSTCGVEYALSAFPRNRRQCRVCRVCRQAYVRRWKAGVRVSREEFAETMRRVNTPAAKKISFSLERHDAIAYAVEQYRAGASRPSAGDVLDAIEPDIWKWLKLANRVVRMAKERG